MHTKDSDIFRFCYHDDIVNFPTFIFSRNASRYIVDKAPVTLSRNRDEVESHVLQSFCVKATEQSP